MLIQDPSWLGQTMLQYMSHSPLAWTIDSEVGDLSSDLLGPEPLLTYLRYNVELEEEELKNLGLAELIPDLKRLRNMDNADTTEQLYEIGRNAAQKQVDAGQFAECFDPPSLTGDASG